MRLDDKVLVNDCISQLDPATPGALRPSSMHLRAQRAVWA
jgi:hypothetical protein